MPKLKRPNVTGIPDEIFDHYMPSLSGAEFKVLCYIARRTFGFRKEADSISLAQISEGIVRKDGRRLDGGTGLNRDTVREALKSLCVEDGPVIKTKRFVGDSRESDTNVYSLNLEAGDGGDEVGGKSAYQVDGKSAYMSAENPPTRWAENPPHNNTVLQQAVNNINTPSPLSTNSEDENPTDADLEAAASKAKSGRPVSERKRRLEERRALGLTTSDQLRALREAPLSGQGGGRPATISALEDATQPEAPAQASTGSVARNPVPPPVLPFAAQEWNRVVTAGPAVGEWTKRDFSMNSAASDPEFLAALPKVLEACQQAFKVNVAEDIDWLNFRWLLRKKANTENWYRIASGEMNWLKHRRNAGGKPEKHDWIAEVKKENAERLAEIKRSRSGNTGTDPAAGGGGPGVPGHAA